MAKKRDELSAWKQMLIRRVDDKDERRTCVGCPKINSNECGETLYEIVSASGGRYMKYQDGRCMDGNKVR